MAFTESYVPLSGFCGSCTAKISICQNNGTKLPGERGDQAVVKKSMAQLSDREMTAHLLRRFGLGASEAELDFYGSGSYEQAVEKLLQLSLADPEPGFDPAEFANGQGVVNIRVMQGLWYARLATTAQPLREKMTLFWHDHFAIGAAKVGLSFVMQQSIDVLRKGALGSFRDLLIAISKDPAMIYWLDGQDNVAGRAQENFGREVMELFTLGIGNYTEKDVQEAARAFTGFSYLGASSRGASQPPRRFSTFAYRADQHDSGEKALLGRKGPFTGEDVLNLLSDHPRTAIYITQKIWAWFVGPLPSDSVIDRLAKTFRDSDLSIAALVKAIMLHPEFQSAKNHRAIVKNPVDYCLATSRALGVGSRIKQAYEFGKANPRINEDIGVNVNLVGALSAAFATLQATKSMGMELMEPPDVAGWMSGEDWITSSTMVERIKWGENLWLGGATRDRVNIGGDVGGRRGPSVAVPPQPIFGANASPQAIAERVISLFDAEVKPATRAAMVKAAEIGSGNLSEAVRGATKVLFASPEFQMC